jgi:SAM-dependent methyltransferase
MTQQAPAEIAASGAPVIRTQDVPACPVCGHGEFATEAVGFDFELITCRNPWRFVRCGECGHVWLHPRPAVEELPVIYPPTYYAYNYEEEINPVAVRGKEALDALKFRGILKRLGRTPGSYLDVGCGTGRFLRLMERQGVPRDAVWGIELDEEPLRKLRADGFNALATRVEDCDEIPAGSIDLATMFHVIEHVDDPAAVVAKIESWLAPDGLLALETPNVESLDHRLFRRAWWGGYHIPRHWNLFAPATLERLLTQAGLQPVATAFQTGHAFWMYSFHHRLRYGRRPYPRLALQFNPFKGLPLLVAFTLFDRARAMLRAPTSAMLVLARKPAASS